MWNDLRSAAMNGTALLVVATMLVVCGVIAIFAFDVARPDGRRPRALVEAALPMLGIGVLLWWAWSAL